MASDILTTNLRRTYVASVLCQDQAFFDRHGPGEVATRVVKDIKKIKTAYGEKMGFLFWALGTILTVSDKSGEHGDGFS